MASKLPSAKRVTARARKDKAFLQRALANPGLRSRITDTSLLPKDVRQKRALEVRLNQKVVPGSAMTERDLARAANAATQVRYGPQEAELGQQLGVAQQQQRDTGSYYDQYLAALAQNQQHVAGVQQQVAQQLQGIGQGITGLGQQGIAAIQNPANADAAARGTQAGDMSQLANQALAVRQALVGGFQGQQALAGGAQNQYANQLTQVIGPAEKLTALAQAAGKVADVTKKRTELAGQRGAYNQQYREEQRAAEGKNVIAQQALNLKTQAELADEAAGRATRRETRRAHKAGETLTAQRLHDQRHKANMDAAAAANKRATTGPFAGLTQTQINNLSDAKARSLVKQYQNRGGASSLSKQEADDFYNKYGVKPQGTAAVARGQDTVRQVQNIISRQGLPKTTENRRKLYSTLVAGQSADKKKNQAGIPKQNTLWTDVALDLWQYGGITGSTAHKLHLAGYPVKTLGFKNAPTRTERNTKSYGKAPAQPQGHY